MTEKRQHTDISDEQPMTKKQRLIQQDSVSLVLSTYILRHILGYIRPCLRKFAALTCVSWHTIISSFGDYKEHKCDQGTTAAFCGYLSYLQYLCQHGYKNNNLTYHAAWGGSLECLKYLHETGHEWDPETCHIAAKKGKLACLQYAHQNNSKWDMRVGENAAQKGQLECLKYAIENGSTSTNLCTIASTAGSLECLKYAHENGCEWDETTCSKAANLDCLRYAHENGCPWDAKACKHAAKQGNIAMLKYAHENGCPWDGRSHYGAHNSGDQACIDYVHANGWGPGL